MKVAISVPDPTFQAAERVSKRLGVSRSQLYARALDAFVKTYRDAEVREALATVYGTENVTIDPTIEQLQAEALREEW